MFRVATMLSGMTPGDQLQSFTAVLKNAGIDILCCQENLCPTNGDYEVTSRMAEQLGMSSLFSTTRMKGDAQRACRPNTTSGLAILSGARTWMLNSGSFPLPAGAEGGKNIVQFAVIRKEGNTVLVLNGSFSSVPEEQKQQLQAVLAYPLLRDHYGAILLCGEFHPEMNESELHRCMAKTRFQVHQRGAAARADGCKARTATADGGGRASGAGSLPMLLFTPREKHLARLEIGASSELFPPVEEETTGPCLGFVTEFELTRLPLKKKNGRYRLLSFRENWKGCGDKDLTVAGRAAAGY